MRQELVEYEVIFSNGKRERFYCTGGIVEAYANGILHAKRKAWDMRIDRILQGDKVYDRPQLQYEYSR